MKRFNRAILVGMCLGLTAPLATAMAAPPPPAQAPGIRPGAILVAIRQVKIRQATLRKGTKVRVISVAHKAGRPVSVNLELPDGHVIGGVAYRVVAQNFRPVPPRR